MTMLLNANVWATQLNNGRGTRKCVTHVWGNEFIYSATGLESRKLTKLNILFVLLAYSSKTIDQNGLV